MSASFYGNLVKPADDQIVACALLSADIYAAQRTALQSVLSPKNLLWCTFHCRYRNNPGSGGQHALSGSRTRHDCCASHPFAPSWDSSACPYHYAGWRDKPGKISLDSGDTEIHVSQRDIEETFPGKIPFMSSGCRNLLSASSSHNPMGSTNSSRRMWGTGSEIFIQISLPWRHTGTEYS